MLLALNALRISTFENLYKELAHKTLNDLDGKKSELGNVLLSVKLKETTVEPLIEYDYP